MTRAVLYLRMSSDKQERSIEDQRGECRKLAKANKYSVLREYVDEAISGDDTENRAAFQRMIADSSGGKFEGVLCWDQDRFGRFDAVEAGYWIKPLRDNGVWLETVAQGRIDWNDFAGRIIFSVTQEAKHAYLRDLSRNVSRGMLSAAKEGKPLSPLPFGYVSNGRAIEIIETEAEVVREIYRLFLGGMPTREIAMHLNRNGIPAPKNGRWAQTTVCRTLKREAYTGVFVWNAQSESKYSEVLGGEIVPVRSRQARRVRDAEDLIRITGNHEPIIDVATFRKVQVQLQENRKHTSPRTGQAAFALSGLLFCSECGAVMYGRQRPSRQRYYVCRTAYQSRDCLPRKAEESEVLFMLSGMLAKHFSRKAGLSASARRRLSEKRTRNERASIERRLSTLRQKINQAKLRVVECEADMLPIVQQRLRQLLSEESALVARLDECEAPNETNDRLQAVLAFSRDLPRIHEADPSRMKTELRRIVSRAVVFTTYREHRHPGFLLERLQITLRDGSVLN